jgi:hypothetical protein
MPLRSKLDPCVASLESGSFYVDIFQRPTVGERHVVELPRYLQLQPPTSASSCNTSAITRSRTSENEHLWTLMPISLRVGSWSYGTRFGAREFLLNP